MQNLEIGGLENGVVNLVNRIDRQLFDMVICCLRGYGGLKQRVSPSVKVIDLNESRGFQVSTMFRIAVLCRKEKVDVVHTHGWAGGFFSGIIGAKLSSVPVILNGEHGTMYFDRPLRASVQRWLAGAVDGIVPVSAVLKNDVIRNFRIGSHKVFPVINGVDTDKFRPDNYCRVSARKEFGIGDKEILVGAVGRLVPVKDYTTLLRATARVMNEISSLKLLLVGDGFMRHELEELSWVLGIDNRVVFTGARQDIPKLLNAMDIFVNSSMDEGLSNTILEAMSTGKPVIATNVGGNPEIVLDNETGVLVPVGDHGRLAKEILQMTDKRRMRSMGIKARSRINECFSLKRMVLDYENLYQKLYKKKMYL
jgi:sugar transferase (PEP-CTERM/EpsH1 system associated)